MSVAEQFGHVDMDPGSYFSRVLNIQPANDTYDRHSNQPVRRCVRLHGRAYRRFRTFFESKLLGNQCE